MAAAAPQRHLDLLFPLQQACMLDYSLVAAVAAVVREGSFERAALALHVTASAVSQRVKLLEQRLGQCWWCAASPAAPPPQATRCAAMPSR
jgi:hypothetical protein